MKHRISTPGYFGCWRAVQAFADRLRAAMEQGQMSRANYRRRLKRICKLYEYEARMRVYAQGISMAKEETV